jgi:hypothetical protein
VKCLGGSREYGKVIFLSILESRGMRGFPEHQRGETPGREVELPVKRRRSVPKVQVRVPENDGGGRVPQREDEVEEGRRRVRFNEEVQMQSIGGREYVRDVVDNEGQRGR